MRQEFTPESRATFKQTLIDKCAFLPGDPTPDEIVDYCERVGFIADAGIGSLLKGTHAAGQVDRIKGNIPGFSARFDNAFTWYGATREFPSLMLGATATGNEQDQLPCIVTQKKLQDAEGHLSAQPAIDFITTFEQRENPPEHKDFYRRRFVRVNTDNGEIIALLCENNPDNPLFVGDKLTLEEKAILMANEWGAMFRGFKDEKTGGLQRDEKGEYKVKSENGALARTIYAYLIEIVDGRLQHGFPVEDELWELVHLANYYREQMYPEKRVFLEALDSGIMVSPMGAESERSPLMKELLEKGYNASEALDRYLEMHGDGNLRSVFRTVQNDKRALNERVFESKPPKRDQGRTKPLSAQEYRERLGAARREIRKILRWGDVPEKNTRLFKDKEKTIPEEIPGRIVPETDIVAFPAPSA